MTKKLITLFTILLLILATTTTNSSANEGIITDDTLIDFGTDGYHEDGCFC